jgi:hypothetical protein
MKSLLKFALVAAMAGLIAGCGPQGNKNNQTPGQTQSATTQDQTTMGRHHGGKLRRICANDIQKYCTSGKKIRKCLRDISDKLEPDCKTALEKAIERHRERKLERQQRNNQNQQPATGTMQQTPTTTPNQMAPQKNQNSSSDDDDDDN